MQKYWHQHLQYYILILQKLHHTKAEVRTLVAITSALVHSDNGCQQDSLVASHARRVQWVCVRELSQRCNLPIWIRVNEDGHAVSHGRAAVYHTVPGCLNFTVGPM